MFSKEQIEALNAPLASRHVKQRAQAGRQLSYIEGWHAIEEANRIFGFDAWDRETIELRQLGEPREVDGKWRVAYMARVRVTVQARHGVMRGDSGKLGGVYPDTVSDNIRRDGCGYGSGIDRDIGSAHESAIKEAETDAMKRALMTFGNPFGLALYDKDQKNVTHDVTPLPSEIEPHEATRKSTAIYEKVERAMKDSKSLAALKAVATDMAREIESLPAQRRADLRKVYEFTAEALKTFQGEAA